MLALVYGQIVARGLAPALRHARRLALHAACRAGGLAPRRPGLRPGRAANRQAVPWLGPSSARCLALAVTLQVVLGSGRFVVAPARWTASRSVGVLAGDDPDGPPDQRGPAAGRGVVLTLRAFRHLGPRLTVRRRARNCCNAFGHGPRQSDLEVVA